MASLKKVLFKVLEGVLGDFIVGFNPEQLQLGLWSGSVELVDLEVNASAVRKLGLPLALEVGKVARISVSIPWTSLGSTPVRIDVMGIEIVCGLEKAPAELKPEELAQRLIGRIRARLGKSDAAFFKEVALEDEAAAPKGTSEPGRLARWAAMIVDNLEVKIQGLTFRVLERGGEGGLDAVVHVGGFEAVAADSVWEPRFVQRGAGETRLFNVARLRSFGVTLNGEAVLAPGAATLRVTRDSRLSEPAYDAALACDKAEYAFRATAVRAAVAFSRRLARLARQQALATRHPSVTLGARARPVTRGASARAWWAYAAEFVCPAMAHERRRRLDNAKFWLATSRSKQRYTQLFDAYLDRRDRPPPLIIADEYEGDEEAEAVRAADAEMGAIELETPVATLALWRRAVLRRRHDEQRGAMLLTKQKTVVPAADAAAATTATTTTDGASPATTDGAFLAQQEQQPGFFGRLFRRRLAGPVKGLNSDDGPTVEDLHAKLAEIEQSALEEQSSAKKAGRAVLMRLEVGASVSVAVVDDRDGKEAAVPLFTFDAAAVARARVGADAAIDVALELCGLSIVDETGILDQSGLGTAMICPTKPEVGVSQGPRGVVVAPLRGSSSSSSFSSSSEGRATRCAAAALLEDQEPLLPGRRGAFQVCFSKRGGAMEVEVDAASYRYTFHPRFVARVAEAFKSQLDEADVALLHEATAAVGDSTKAYAGHKASEAMGALEREAYATAASGPTTSSSLPTKLVRKASFSKAKTTTLTVSARVGAPVLLLPRSMVARRGHFVVALGALAVDGSLVMAKGAGARSEWHVSLADVGIAEYAPTGGAALSDVIKPFGLNLLVAVKQPDQAAPLTLSLAFQTFELEVSPTSLRHLLQVVALAVSGGRKGDAVDEASSSLVVGPAEETSSVALPTSPSGRTRSVVREKHPPGAPPTGPLRWVPTPKRPRTKRAPAGPGDPRIVAIHIGLTFSTIQVGVVADEDCAPVYDLTLRGTAAQLAFSNKGLTIDVGLESLCLQRSDNVVVIESSAFSGTKAAAALGRSAHATLPAARQSIVSGNDDDGDDAGAEADRLLTVKLDISETAMDMNVVLSRLRLHCGGDTLRPLKPLVDALKQGLAAFKGGGGGGDDDDVVSQGGNAEKKALPGQPPPPPSSPRSPPPRRLEIVATIGEIDLVLLTPTEEAVAHAALRGSAVLFRKEQWTSMCAVRVVGLELADPQGLPLLGPQQRPANATPLSTPRMGPRSLSAASPRPRSMLMVFVDWDAENGGAMRDEMHSRVKIALHPIALEAVPHRLTAFIQNLQLFLASWGKTFGNDDTTTPAGPGGAAATTTTTTTTGEGRMLAPDWAATSMVLDMNLEACELLLRRDPVDRATTDTLAVHLGGSVVVENASAKKSGATQHVKAELLNLCLTLKRDDRDETLTLVQPIAAKLDYQRTLDTQQFVVDTFLEASLSLVDVGFSYRDAGTIVAICGAAFPPKDEDEAVSPTTPASPALAEEEENKETEAPPPGPPPPSSPSSSPPRVFGSKVATVRLQAGLAGLTVAVRDDSVGPSVPLLRVTATALEATCEGPVTRLEGRLSGRLGVEGYNRSCLRHEPLVPRCGLVVTLGASVDERRRLRTLDVAVESTNVFDVIITKDVATSVIELAHRWSADRASLKVASGLATALAAKKRRKKKPDAEARFVLRNRTQRRVRCRVAPDRGEATDERRGWRDVEPEGQVALVNADGSPPHRVDVAAAGSEVFRRCIADAPVANLDTFPGDAGGEDEEESQAVWRVTFDGKTGQIVGCLNARVTLCNKTGVPLEVQGLDGRTVLARGAGQNTPLHASMAKSDAIVRIRPRRVVAQGEGDRPPTEDVVSATPPSWSEDVRVWTGPEHHQRRKSSNDPAAAALASLRTSPPPSSSPGSLMLLPNNNNNNNNNNTRPTPSAPNTPGRSSMARSLSMSLSMSRSNPGAQPSPAAKKRTSPAPRMVLRSFASDGAASFFVVAPKISRSSAELELVAAAPLCVSCRTPCGVVVSLSAASRRAERILCVSPGEDAYCMAFHPQDDAVDVGLRLGAYAGRLAQPVALAAHAGAVVVVDLEDDERRKLRVEVRVDKRYGGAATRLTVSCPLWIVDATGLRLAFATAPPAVTVAGLDFSKLRLQEMTMGAREDRLPVDVAPEMRRAFGVRRIVVDSKRRYLLAPPANVGDRVYADPRSAYWFDAELPSEVAAACRLVTYDTDRAGVDAWKKPEALNVVAEQTRGALRSVGLELKSQQRKQREVRFMSINAGAEPLVVYLGVDAAVARVDDWISARFQRCQGATIRVLKAPRQHAAGLRLPVVHGSEVRELALWRTVVPPEHVVDLGANREGMMYTVFLAKHRSSPSSASASSEASPMCAFRLVSRSSSDDTAGEEGDKAPAEPWKLAEWPGRDWVGIPTGADARPCSMLHSPAGHVTFGVGGKSWSPRHTVAHREFVTCIEPPDSCAGGPSYEVLVRPGPLSGKFARHGTVIRVSARFAVRNVDATCRLAIRQRGVEDHGGDTANRTRRLLDPAMGRAEPWHWPDRSKPREVEFGIVADDDDNDDGANATVEWAEGAVALGTLGGFALNIPPSSSSSSSKGSASSSEFCFRAIRVEVTLNNSKQGAEEPPHSAILVSVCLDRLEAAPLYVARNRLSVPVEVYDSSGAEHAKGRAHANRPTASAPENILRGAYEGASASVSKMASPTGGAAAPVLVARLAPGASACFGFARAGTDAKRTLRCRIRRLRPVDVTVDVDALGPQAKGGGGAGALQVDVSMRDGSRVFDFSSPDTNPPGDSRDEFEEEDNDNNTTTATTTEAANEEAPAAVITLRVKLKGVGVTLCADSTAQDRQELTYARLEAFEVTARQTAAALELEASIAEVQMDNYGPNALWPTFISRSEAAPQTNLGGGGNNNKEKERQPALSLVVVRDTLSDKSTALRYLALRVLPLDIRADKASLLEVNDALRAMPLELLDADALLATAAPAEWASALAAAPVEDPPALSLKRARAFALRKRGFIEALVIHPMQVTLSYEATGVEVGRDHKTISAMDFLEHLASIERAHLKINSFAVAHASESPQALTQRIIRHVVFQVVQQMHKVVGSLASFGAPANLVSTIGGGAREFFYAPAAGALLGPQDFAKGVFKGTAGLGGSIVGGLSKSVAGVGNAVSSNISMLSADAEFVAERDARRRRQQLSDQKGAGAGLLAGGEYLVRGVGEGVTGVFTRPVEGAMSGGAKGFFKGAAQGILGVVVKPVVGVFDGGTSVLQGVSQQFDQRKKSVAHIRPPRRFVKIPNSDAATLVVDDDDDDDA